MYKFLFLFSFSLFFVQGYSQEPVCHCEADLRFVREELEDTPSYDDQIVGQEDLFELHYQEIVEQAKGEEISVFGCYLLLNQLLEQVRDRHTEIYGNGVSVSWEEMKDSTFMAEFRNSVQYKLFPRKTENLDSLEMVLGKRPVQEVEGIYYYGDYFKIAVVRKENDKFHGIVLKSQLPVWTRGEVMFILQELGGSRYSYIGGLFMNKNLIKTTEMVRNGQFAGLPWTKDPEKADFSRLDYSEKNYELKTLSEELQYLKLGSFGSSGEQLVKAKEFFQKIKNRLFVPHLIVDLRHNSGGGDKNSRRFFKLLKRYARKNHLYLLIGFNTKSKAEQFTVKLKDRDNVMTLGEPTRGKLSYGWNTSKDYVTPSGLFRFHPTDLDNSEYLEYEEVGIVPEIVLDPSRDWVDQVRERLQE